MRRFEKLWQRDEKLTFLIFTKLKGKKGGKIKVGIITIIYVGDEGGLKPTNISGKHDITSV